MLSIYQRFITMSLQSTAGIVCSTQITLTSFYENASPSTPLLMRTGQSGKEDEGTLHVLILGCMKSR